MNDIIGRIKILIGAEKALFSLRMGKRTASGTLYIGAALFALLALGMLNFSGFAALRPTWDDTVAALIVAAIDGAVVVVILIVSRFKKDISEHERALMAIRDAALKSLEDEIDGYRDEVEHIVREVRSVREGIAEWGGIASTVGLLVRSLSDAFSGTAPKGTKDGDNAANTD